MEIIKRSKRLVSALPLLLVITFTIITVWPLTTVRLDRHDHPTHLFKAWQFFTEMLLHGRLGGYNHHWAFGYPINDIVPCAEELWVALCRLLTFAWLSWEDTYKLALAGLLVFLGIASYTFASRYFGRITAAIAALFAVLDPGGLYQGGWEWLANFGVWPVTLSCCCILMAWAKLEDVLRNSARHHIVVAGIWIAAALWSHPLSLVLLVLALPPMLFEHWTRGSNHLLHTWLRVGLSYAVGFGLASFFVVPMLTRSHYVYDRGGLGESVEHWAHKIVDLKLFDGNWSLILAFGLVGAIRALVSRRRGAVLLTVAFCVCLVFATNLKTSFFHAERIMPGLIKFESDRMIMGCKLFGFPLAAYGVTSLFSLSTDRFIVNSRARDLAKWLLVLGLMAPFIAPATKRIYESYVDKRFATDFSAELTRDYSQLNRWALAQHQSSPDFYRIAYCAPSLEMLQSASPLLSNTPVYLDNGTVAQHFNVFPADLDPGLLEALSVKYVVSDGKLSDPVFVPERSFGKLQVYRFSNYRKERLTVIGQGQAGLLTIEPDLIRVQVANAGPGTRLKLHVAAYERWKAVQGNQTLPISVATVFGHEFPVLMEVPVSSGVVEFRFVRCASDWIGLALSLMTVFVVALYTVLPRRWRPRFSLTDFVQKHAVRIRWIAVTAIVGAGVLIVLRAQTREHLLPANSIFHRVDGHNLTVHGNACVKNGPLAFECRNYPLEAQSASGSWGAHLCMTTGERRPLTISLATKLGSAIQIFTDTFADNGSVKVSVNNQELGSAKTRRSHADWRIFQFETSAFAGRESSQLKIEVAGAVLRCFDIRVVP